jgi:hypothetical protein
MAKNILSTSIGFHWQTSRSALMFSYANFIQAKKEKTPNANGG